MTFYPVFTQVKDNGTASMKRLPPVEASRKPKDTFKSLPFCDIYTDYFRTAEEADAFIEENKDA